MSNKQLDLKLDEDGRLVVVGTPKDQDNWHIEAVEIYSGPNDYEEASKIIVSSSTSGILKIEPAVPKVLIKNRPRGEPGLRLHVINEAGSRAVINIDPHKGNFYMTATKSNLPDDVKALEKLFN